jgi:predicted dinucleotide-binding enzyme
MHICIVIASSTPTGAEHMTRIAVIGAGNIGGTLGRAWERAGHRIAYAAGTPKPPETVAVADALEGAEVAVFAVPGTAVDALIDEHADALAGKLVIDATNRMGQERLDNTEALARVPGARVARAFNTIGWERHIYAATYGEPPDPPATAALVDALAQAAATTADRRAAA